MSAPYYTSTDLNVFIPQGALQPTAPYAYGGTLLYHRVNSLPLFHLLIRLVSLKFKKQMSLLPQNYPQG
jgi:hypothetical protein